MGKTKIEWVATYHADGTVAPGHSINPLKARNIATGAVGHFCAKISPGCKFCYSSRMQSPYLTQIEFLAENRSKIELFFDDKAIQQVLSRRKPTRYFWMDMTDAFLDDYPDEWIDRCFAAMALTPQHTHMVLTKRDERLREYWSRRIPGSVERETKIIYAMEKLTDTHPRSNGASAAMAEPRGDLLCWRSGSTPALH